MKQTAVEWFDDEFCEIIQLYTQDWKYYGKLIKESKEIEKKQMIEYHNFIVKKFLNLEYTYNTSAKTIVEQYYKETFKSE
jgi:hypothetical protein